MENWKEEKVNAPKKGLWQRLAALAAAAALVLSLAGCSGLPSVPGGSADVVPNPSASAAAAVDTVDAPLEVHFIDVGQALSVLVECDGQFMLYDGGNVDDGSLIVSYLQSQGGGTAGICVLLPCSRGPCGRACRRNGKVPGGARLQPGDREQHQMLQ